tara:strand:- start:757 stop:945 length:189 start_codon:yes stop_codon:yes gene_type:complete
MFHSFVNAEPKKKPTRGPYKCTNCGIWFINGKSNRCPMCGGLGQPKEVVDREAKKTEKIIEK